MLRDNMPKNKQRSPKRIEIERRIEAFIYWSASILMLLLGLICTVIYFNKGVSQNDVIVAVRIQLVTFTTAFFCCPLTPIPEWFPVKSQYRFVVFLLGIVGLELISQGISSTQ
jgi:hypothetical protein